MSRPLKEAVSAYAAGSPARFHMPGHKGFLSALDVTELSGTDNLHSPTAAIAESEALCAKAQGAASAFFLVNGSSAGNLAMLFSIGCGRRVLLGRNCHKSAINALALSDHDAVPLFPDEDGVFTADKVRKALEKKQCGAVFLTSPTYRGAVSPIADIANVCHEHGALLLIDAAHGAHFPYSAMLPPVPREADMWCVSCHKTLFSLTQSALLLRGESCTIPAGDIRRALNMFQSTSPSYELMLSIEGSVLGAAGWDAHMERIADVRERLERIPGASLLGSRDPEKQDLSRLNIAFSGRTGYALQSHLESRGVFCEMADRECVTLITSPADPDEWYGRLIDALSMLETRVDASENYRCGLALRPGERVLSVREAVTGQRELVGLEDSLGRISAGAVGCYPPGVALLFPGERIEREALEALMLERNEGAELFGLDSGRVPVLCER